MRVRYRRSALIKFGLLVLLFLVVLPFVYFKYSSPTASEEEYIARLRRKQQLAKDRHKTIKLGNVGDSKVAEFDQGGKDDGVPPQNVVDNPIDVKHEEKEVLGPEARLTPGKLGNFEPKNYPSRNGPGEGGQAVYTKMEEKMRADQSIREYGFNMINSDKVAMDRTIPDTRLDECKYWQYPEDLPTASVILVFHNEGFSTLVRTVHSIINMSPPKLLKEVVMVDDFSDKAHLKDKLEDYIKQFNGKVKLYRNKERMGLIGTRTRGAELSKGDVIVFLDAHCECNRNWLPPLLARIRHNRRTMAVPIVDGIDWDNFAYHPVYSAVHHRGIFEWGFLYKESVVPQKELQRRQHNSEAYRSPTHAGGLFAMERNYFFELGAYDPGLKI